MRAPCPHLLSLYRRSNSNIFIFRDALRAGELLVPKSGPKSALNPESALNIIINFKKKLNKYIYAYVATYI